MIIKVGGGLEPLGPIGVYAYGSIECFVSKCQKTFVKFGNIIVYIMHKKQFSIIICSDTIGCNDRLLQRCL